MHGTQSSSESPRLSEFSREFIHPGERGIEVAEEGVILKRAAKAEITHQFQRGGVGSREDDSFTTYVTNWWETFAALD